MGYREEATDRATNQYASLMHGLQGASKWTVHLVLIVGGMCGSVHAKIFKKNMELLGVIESKWNEVRRQHVFKLMEEQDKVLRSFFAQKKGGDTSGRPTGPAEGQSISEEMCTLEMGGAIATKVMGQWRCARAEEVGRLPRLQNGESSCSRRPCKSIHPCVHTHACILSHIHVT